MRATSSATNTTDPRRGDKLATGGRFVGQHQSPRSSLWVSYGGEDDFQRMCRAFDAMYSARPTAIRRAAAVA